uniref:Glycosyltransferase n=1 Tax=viral metagenome TaxID=1070528 RepID=A0A6C0EQC4_9ZZZZ
MENIRIAFVKSSVYQDLWVTDITNNYIDIFKSTIMRCPPIGLAEHFSADFIIVKDTNDYPCNINKNVLALEYYHTVQFSTNLRFPTSPFLDETYNGGITIDSISHNVDDIEWSKYNIVICINTCIPERVIEKYESILWCYFVGENDDIYVNQIISKYDCILNQDVCKPNLPWFSIGFPYSFVGPYTIENLVNKVSNVNILKNGVFQEINNTRDRPVLNPHPEFLQIERECNMPIILHSQNIVENIKRICQSKYFVKLFGRVIRGNGILEVISAGTLVLINKNLIMFRNLIPDECHVESVQDIINKIHYFENNESEYKRLIDLQRENLSTYYFKKPINDLIDKYYVKQTTFISQ